MLCQPLNFGKSLQGIDIFGAMRYMQYDKGGSVFLCHIYGEVESLQGMI